MRGALAAAVALLAVCAAASAHTVTTPVHVELTVAEACKIDAPNTIANQTAEADRLARDVPPAGDAKTPLIALDALLPNCQTGVRPLLSFASDGLDGVYVATIDF
jgi:type 1 fimbria pilin